MNAEINAALTSTLSANTDTEEKIKEKLTEIDSLTGTLTHLTSEDEDQVFIEDLSEKVTSEPTSTAPVAATREAPLPDATVFIEAAITTQDEEVSNIEASEELSKVLPKEEIKTDGVENETVTLDVLSDEASTSLSVEIEENNELLGIEKSNELADIEKSVTESNETTQNESEQGDAVAENTDGPAEQSQISYHKIKDGETLFSVSVKYNVKLKTLRKWNKLSAKHKLQINEKIYVVNPETVTNSND
jgi:type IV pilus assembly protein PilF